MMKPSGYTILVVDDDLGVLRVVVRMLEAAGYNVLATESGHDALAVLEHLRVDLLLIDLVMPGISGEEVATSAQRLPDPPRILVMSSHHDAEPRDHIGWPVLTKPFNRIALLAGISAVLV